MRELHEIVREEFAKTGMSQKAFAKAIGAGTQQTLSNWLNGHGLRLDVIPVIEDVLDLDRGFILRKAGYVKELVTTEDVIRSDHAIEEALEREFLIDAYRSAVKRASSSSGGASTSAANRRRRVK